MVMARGPWQLKLELKSMLLLMAVVTSAWLALRLGAQKPREQQEEQSQSRYQELLDSFSQQQ
jgi:hypothetical protein